MKTWMQKIGFCVLLSGLLLAFVPLVGPVAAEEQKPDLATGARLWKQNCTRCHNLRRPPERSDRQWDIIVMHMRLRANLVGRDAEAILNFIKTSN